MESTWASCAIELLSHADSHIDLNTAFDKRIAFISVDNAVENMVRTFHSLPPSKSDVKIKRREIEEAGNSFPLLLGLLYKYAGDKLVGIDDADIEHYHRIRNTLYHNPTGLSVDDQYLKAYRGIAEVLLQNLFGAKPKKHITDDASLENLIQNWNKIEQVAKKQIEKLGFSTSFKWEEKFVHSHISEDSSKQIAELRKARNQLVRSTNIDKEEIRYWVEISKKLLNELQESKELSPHQIKSLKPEKKPSCFISYSWDSKEHCNWVRSLAEKLQQNGVNTILDQWDLRPGMDIAHFMEKSISSSDYVLLICTPIFAAKANKGIGGVGYEKNIVTAEIFKKIKAEKNIVPILRAASEKDAIPTYLGSKKYIDFWQDKNFEQNTEELLRHIYEIPKFQKPFPVQTPLFNDPSSKENRPDSFNINDLDELALRWKNEGFPYFIVEGLQEIQKAFVRHPPKNIKIENPVTLAFLLLAGFHFGGNWCHWLTINVENELIMRCFESSFSVSYRGPLYRSLFALQYLEDNKIITGILESGIVDEASKKLIESYVTTGNFLEYLTKTANEDKGKTGQRAASVIKEINQYCGTK